MSRYLLDTDTLTLLEHNHPRVTAQVNGQPAADVVLSSISVQEQMQGWLGLLNKARTPRQIEDAHAGLATRLLPAWGRFRVVPFDQAALQRFDPLRAQRLNVGSMDLRIAAVALVHGLIVVTRNRRDFGRIPNLGVVDWSI